MTVLVPMDVAGPSRPSPAVMQAGSSDVRSLPRALPAWWPGHGWSAG